VSEKKEKEQTYKYKESNVGKKKRRQKKQVEPSQMYEQTSGVENNREPSVLEEKTDKEKKTMVIEMEAQGKQTEERKMNMGTNGEKETSECQNGQMSKLDTIKKYKSEIAVGIIFTVMMLSGWVEIPYLSKFTTYVGNYIITKMKSTFFKTILGIKYSRKHTWVAFAITTLCNVVTSVLSAGLVGVIIEWVTD